MWCVMIPGLRAAESFEGKPIASIQFDPAAQPLPDTELADLLQLRAGDRYSAPAVRTAMQRLFATGRYADISIDASAAAGGVALRFITKDNLFIGRVTADGSPDPPNPGQLVTAAKLQLGAEYAANDVPQAIENMMTRLRANGLYNASIASTKTLDPAIQQINIDFSVDPGPRARFDGVEVDGDPSRSRDAIIASTRWRRPFGLFGWRYLTEDRLQNGIENVRRYYTKQNRLLARVTLAELIRNEDVNTVTPRLNIDPGPIIRVQTPGQKISR